MIEASVREWYDEYGWGVLDSEETPGGCWVHYSHLDTDGCQSLSNVGTVFLDYEQVGQDGYAFRAVRVEVPGQDPRRPTEASPSDAYRSSLRIDWDDD